MDEDEKQQRIAELRELIGAEAFKAPEHYSDLEKNVERVFKKRGWTTLRWAAQFTGITHTTIRVMKQGKRTGADTLMRWARAIGEDAAQWLTWGGHDPKKYLPSVPNPTAEQIAADPLLLVGRDVNADMLANAPLIGAGVPATPNRVRDGEGEDYKLETTSVKLPTGVRTMEVVGDCMEPLLHDGDIVYVRPATHANTGDIVIALVDMSGITCKVYRKDEGGRSYLEPYLRAGGDPETGDQPKPGEGRIPEDRFSIAGVVVGYFRPIGVR